MELRQSRCTVLGSLELPPLRTFHGHVTSPPWFKKKKHRRGSTSNGKLGQLKSELYTDPEASAAVAPDYSAAFPNRCSRAQRTQSFPCLYPCDLKT